MTRPPARLLAALLASAAFCASAAHAQVISTPGGGGSSSSAGVLANANPPTYGEAASAQASGDLHAAQRVFLVDPTNNDAALNPNLPSATYTGGSSNAGAAIAPGGAAAASNAILKNAAGNLYDVYGEAGASNGYIYVFNATSMPGDGAATFGTSTGNYEVCFPVGANSGARYSLSPGPAMSFSIGITVAFSSTDCGTFTHATATLLTGAVQ